jgi:hypothetical protein
LRVAFHHALISHSYDKRHEFGVMHGGCVELVLPQQQYRVAAFVTTERLIDTGNQRWRNERHGKYPFPLIERKRRRHALHGCCSADAQLSSGIH